MRNEDILAPLLPEITALRNAERSWWEIGQLLEERGVVSLSGLPFSLAALRTYSSNAARPKKTPLAQRLEELEAVLKAESNARLAAECQRDHLARVMIEYLVARTQWVRRILSMGERDIGPMLTDHQRHARELFEAIETISPAVARTADRAGALLTLLCWDLAGQESAQLPPAELSELRLADEDLDSHLQRQHQADGFRWELAIAAAGGQRS